MNLVTILILVLIAYSNVKSQSFKWEPLHAFNNFTEITSNEYRLMEGQIIASDLIGGQNVYVSLTTISNRIYGLAEIIGSVIVGTVVPNHIYIFLSKEPHLLDKGITEKDALFELRRVSQLRWLYPNISVIFTDNIGPHRKLIPLLQHKWSEDCVIITIDDHEIYPPTALAGLLWYYVESGGDAVVAHRSRRMSICNDGPPWRLSHYFGSTKGLWPVSQLSIREHLILPTGCCGVLYRPRFFNENYIFDRNLINITKTGDDLMFRLVTMTKNIEVVTSCTEETRDPDYYCPNRPLSTIAKKLITNTKDSIFVTLNEVNYKLFHKFDNILNYTTNIQLHHLRHKKTKGSRHRDERKKISLATNYNIKGGNNLMWDNAINYLYNKSFYFDDYLQKSVLNDREDCVKQDLFSKIKQVLYWECGFINCHN